MNKKFIKKLANASYTKNKLDSKKVNRIVKVMTRNELKSYINALKIIEKSKNTYIFVPNSQYLKSKTTLQNIFPNKNVIFVEDKSLVAGIKVIDNDIVYEENIKDNLSNIINYLNQ